VLLFNLFVAMKLFTHKWVHGLLVLLFVLLLLTPMLLSTAGKGSTPIASTVQVEKTATVGSYTISILRPSRSDGLDGWLAENGFAALPEAAGPIVADYISQGWVFAAIKLTRGESGANAPHPIKLVFASKKAVYPMKLTAIAGGKPGFELFILGDDRAACDMLEEEFCDRFSKTINDEWDKLEPQSLFVGAGSGCKIGHSVICSLMWDNSVLTKFVGNVDSASMTRDIHFAWRPFKSHQQHYFTQEGARDLAVMLFVIVVGVWNVFSMYDYVKRPIRPKRPIHSFAKRLALAIFCAAVVAGVCFALLPKLGNSDIQVSRRSGYAESRFRRDFSGPLLKNPDTLKRTELGIATFLVQELRNRVVPVTANLITGGELKVEDSPGNFTIEKQANQVIVRSYDRFGTAFVKTFPIGATGKSDQPGAVPDTDRGVKH
jgi:hypothetical protein